MTLAIWTLAGLAVALAVAVGYVEEREEANETRLQQERRYGGL